MRLRWHGRHVKMEVERASRRGMTAAAEYVLGEARKEVPIEEGTLERSGATDVAADGQTATVFFDTPYAVVQHEDLTFRHDAGRKAKYLEDPLNRSGDAVRDILRDEIRRAF